jgi:hypothetical protein
MMPLAPRLKGRRPMTDDIVTRLRVGIHTSVDPLALTNEAADRIEALEAALREKDNIAYIIDSHGMTHQSFVIVYSAALEGEKKNDAAT